MMMLTPPVLDARGAEVDDFMLLALTQVCRAELPAAAIVVPGSGPWPGVEGLACASTAHPLPEEDDE